MHPKSDASGLLQIGHKQEKWQSRHNLATWRHRQFFYVNMFLLPSLLTGPSFMSISLLLFKLWQFSFVRDWPEIQKSEIHPSEFCMISGDRGELWTSNLAGTSQMKRYWMLKNARVTGFTVPELLRQNQQGVKLLSPQTSRLELNLFISEYI